MARALAVVAGREAARRIAAQGWTPALFDLLLGASGGPKWLILGQLDRYLFGDFLQRDNSPLSLLGSSIGSWRHACLAMRDPVAAIDRLERAYLQQAFSARPAPAEVSEVSRDLLRQLLGESGAEDLAGHRRFRSHIVTARGRGAAGASSGTLLAAAMGGAALSNTLSRRLLSGQFQRVVFHSAPAAAAGLTLDDFDTAWAPLTGDNVGRALHASGSIPFVLSGERDIPQAPPGQYWDGGIIDYHFDLGQYAGEGLLLYPHFSGRVVPGWFDKFLPWRGAASYRRDRLVLLHPTADFIASLPLGKIPDRSDFTRMTKPERVRYWQRCIAQSRALAGEFAALVEGPDPLAGVTLLD